MVVKKVRLVFILFVALAIWNGSAHVRSAGQASKEVDGRVKAAIRELGHPEFERRESATQSLEALGEVALPAVREAARKNPDPEIRKRAEQTRKKIESRWLVKKVRGPAVAASRMEISPRGDRVVSFSGEAVGNEPSRADRSLRIWSLQSGELFHKKDFDKNDDISQLTITADGKRALILRRQNHGGPVLPRKPVESRSILSYWDLGTAKETVIVSVSGESRSGSSLIFPVAGSADAGQVLVGSLPPTLTCIDTKTGKAIASLQSPYQCQAAAVVPGKSLAVCAFPDAVCLWDFASGTIVQEFEGHYVVRGLAVSRDGSRFLAGCDSTQIGTRGSRRTEFGAGRGRSQNSPFNEQPVAKAMEPPVFGTGRITVRGVRHDFSCRLVDIRTGQLVKLVGHEAVSDLVAFSPNDKFALTASRDGVAILWDLATMKEARRFEQNKPWPRAIAFTPDNKYALVGNTDNSICMYSLPSSP